MAMFVTNKFVLFDIPSVHCRTLPSSGYKDQ